MRVALLSDWFLPRLGGLELQLRDLAGALAAAGHQVHVITTTPGDPGRQGRLQTAPADVPEGVTVHRLDVPLVRGLNASASPRLVEAIRRVLSDIEPHVVHGQVSIGSTAVLAGGRAAHDLGIASVATFHSVLGPWRLALRAVDVALGWSRWPNEVGAVSRTVARDVRWLLPGRRVHLLPNGFDPGRWRVTPVVGDSRSLRIVTVMRLQRRKRGHALLAMVAEATRRLEPGRAPSLTVVGDGPERASLEAAARRNGLEGRVAFTGTLPREEIADVFARSDVFLLASVQESFGLAALEARAAGLAVVARGDSGVGELFQHGREALLARTDADVTESLVRLGRDRSLLERIRAHNRSVTSPGSWPEVVARHEELYEDAARAPRRVRSSQPVPVAGMR